MTTRKRTPSSGFSSVEKTEDEKFVDAIVDEILEEVAAAEEFVKEATPEPAPEPVPAPAPKAKVKTAPKEETPVHKNPEPNQTVSTRPRRNIPRFSR